MENFKDFDENNYREFLTANSISLKSVKNQTALMKKFCDASAIYETSSKKNNIYNANQIKEVILVIPKKNGIDVSEETNSFLLKTAIDFYKENHPNNEILIAFSHSDETTNHCHLFLNLRNSKTNKFDFVEQETELAEKNQHMALRNKPKFEDFKTGKRKETTANKLLLNETQKWRGETLQRLFYQHFNKSAKEQAMDFEAVFNVKNSTNEDAYKFMNEQSKLPKENDS
jgi:Plasmid recombination enzyme.